MNRLYYGGKLEVLRNEIADASVDLISLDPPFNSNAGYNVPFKSASGAGADASIEAFDDTWTWGAAAKEALMACLAMMAVRLVEQVGRTRISGL